MQATTAAPTAPQPGASQTPLGELRALVHLAVPLAAAHFGQMLLGAVDTAVVGRAGEAELGATGLGNSVYFTLLVFGIGVVLGLDPLVAQAVGAKELTRARRLLWQGVWIALALGVVLVVSILGLASALGWFGIGPGTVSLTLEYLVARAPAVIPYLVFASARSYLQALGFTKALVWGVVVANVVNLPLSWVLVFGDQFVADFGVTPLGVPALGVAGAGWASTVSTLIQMAFVVVAIRRIDAPKERGYRSPDRALLIRALRLGFPIGLTLFAEVGVFGLVNVAMGNISSSALAGHQVALTLVAMTFMIPLGVGAAASVRVGHAIGRGDHPGTRLAGLVSLAAGVGFMGFSAILFLLFPAMCAALITDKPEVIAAAVPLIFVGAIFQLSDGCQAVAAGALRGAGDTKFALWANVLGHYALGLPIALVLGFGTALGPQGLWWGLSAGLTAVAIALTARFFRVTSRPVGRV